MLIKYIQMGNFRQFKDEQRIDVATDEHRNISIIMGENGTGKTTLAQAFLWGLYGITEFKNSELINKKTLDEMQINDSAYVFVELCVESDDQIYYIRRKQKYVRNLSKINALNAELSINYKDANGNIKSKPEDECQFFINSLLPRELSGFFIFSGERIKDMSDEIQKGKSKEFSVAVKNLVGLNAMMESLNHLKGAVNARNTSALSVIGRYNKKIDDSGDKELKNISRDIETYTQLLTKNNEQLNELKCNLEGYEKDIKALEAEIVSYASLQKDKDNFDKFKNGLKGSKEDYKNNVKNFMNYFSKHSLSFFLQPIIKSNSKELAKNKYEDKGIPHIHADTIKYLLNHKKCLCGNVVEKDSSEEKELKKLLDFVPPKSIGTLINQNNRMANSTKRESETFVDDLQSYYKSILKSENDIKEYTNSLEKLSERIIGANHLEDLKIRKNDKTFKRKNCISNIDELNRKVGALEQDLKKTNERRDKLISINNDNKEVILYRNYASALYDLINKNYLESEVKVREDLERKINEIFKEILDDGLHLQVDENYYINVTVDGLEEFNDNIERSTAQNYSVIFAFIAAIIEMAKEKKDDTAGIFGKAEGYPLIMDAPLSAFDRRRIKNICNTLPGIANQILFFIKDTDGQVAEKYLGDVVGKKYILQKDSMVVSNLKECE